MNNSQLSDVPERFNISRNMLTISTPTLHDSGSYCCIGDNGVSEGPAAKCTSSYDLNLQGKCQDQYKI